MISNDYVFAQSYEYYDRYHRMKDGKVIYDECFPHDYKEENKSSSMKWTEKEDMYILNEIAQGKSIQEICKGYTGERTKGAVEFRTKKILYELKKDRGEIIREETTGLSLDYVISKELERGEIA